MNENNNLHILFSTLTVALPYEYSEHLNKNPEYIEITKKDSDIVAYIMDDETEPGILNATSYVVENDSLPPHGTAHFDTTDPDFTLLDTIEEIKQLF